MDIAVIHDALPRIGRLPANIAVPVTHASAIQIQEPTTLALGEKVAASEMKDIKPHSLGWSET